MSQRSTNGPAGLPARTEVAVVGAGAAGLGVAASLGRREIATVVLERGEVASSWRQRYDGVRLNTVRWMSGLPGMAHQPDEYVDVAQVAQAADVFARAGARLLGATQ